MYKFQLIFFATIFLMAISSCSNEDQLPIPENYPERINGTISYQNDERSYVLHIPDAFDGTQAAPLVVFLHGGGGNAESAQNFTNFNEISEEYGFLMAYPQAGFKSAVDSYVWADGRGLAPDKLGIDDVGFINKLVEQLIEEYKINENKIYLCGFSNGSFLTQRIAFEANSKFAAIGTLGGTMNEIYFENENPGRAIPMVYVFGTEDPLVPYEGGYVSDNSNFEPVVGTEDAVSFWENNNGCQTALNPVELPNTNAIDNSTVTVFEYTDCDCKNSQVKFYRINGGGHTWPGVPLSIQNLGEVNLDIEASRVLWEFFDQFELCD